MTKFRRLRFLLLVLLGMSAVAQTGTGAQFITPPVEHEPSHRLGHLSLRDLFRSIRIAPGGPRDLTGDALEQLKKKGFNTVFLTDIETGDGTSWHRVPPETIERWLSLARNHDVAVIANSPFVEPDYEQGNSSRIASALSVPQRRNVAMRRATIGSANTTSARSAAQSGMSLRYVSEGEVLASLSVWQRYNQGEVIAITPMGDDPFYMGVPAEKQMEWSRLASIAAPDIPTLGMIGEFALAEPLEDARRYWAPAAYTYLALIIYPYNLGGLWGHPLNHRTSADPDGDLALYIHEYVGEQSKRFLFELQPSQLVLPVIQTFTCDGEDAGMVPRTIDISLQARLIHEELQNTLGQKDNYAMAYFYLGAEDDSGPTLPPKGIDDMPGWTEVVAHENTWLDEAFRLSNSDPTAHQREEP